MGNVEQLVKEAKKYFAIGEDEKAYELVQEAVLENDPEALWILGQMYFEGRFVRKDYGKAYSYFERLAEMGFVQGIWQVVNMNCMLEGEREYDKETHVEYLNKLCRIDDSKAFILLAQAYEEGNAVAQDINKAIELYQRAAELGERFGNECIGKIYYDGKYVPQDYKKALEYYMRNKSWEEMTLYHLGKMYDEGLGTQQNIKKALQFYEMFLERHRDLAANYQELEVECEEDDYYPEVIERVKELNYD